MAVSQIFPGCDYACRTGADKLQGLRDDGFSEADFLAITRGNAARLMPRWKA